MINQSGRTSKTMIFEKYRSLLCICPVILFIIFILTKGFNDTNTSYASNIDKNMRLNSVDKPAQDSTCSWKFLNYTPSAWETYWFSNIESFQYEPCSILARIDQVNQTVPVIRRIISLQNTSFNINSKTMPIDDHFSQMHYRRICSNKEYNAIQLIEPLIGLIRDPLTICPHVPSVPTELNLVGEEDIQSKRFLLLSSSSPFNLEPPSSSNLPTLAPWLYSQGSQKILIDIGSSYFNSRNGNTAEIGTRWFYEYFKNRSIRFDRIIAYEHQQLASRRVWEELPDDVLPFYTLINVGVTAEMGKFNPWKMLETLAKVDDYVVIKLDIDTPPLESALMKQLLEKNNTARYLIDELFFEKHVSLKRNSGEDKLKDTYELFTKLRQFGIRMHGWP